MQSAGADAPVQRRISGSGSTCASSGGSGGVDDTGNGSSNTPGVYSGKFSPGPSSLRMNPGPTLSFQPGTLAVNHISLEQTRRALKTALHYSRRGFRV